MPLIKHARQLLLEPFSNLLLVKYLQRQVSIMVNTFLLLPFLLLDGFLPKSLGLLDLLLVLRLLNGHTPSGSNGLIDIGRLRHTLLVMRVHMDIGERLRGT
jgi:hypothetical protein